MHRACVWIFVLLFLALLPGCGEEGPRIDEVLVFDDADVESIGLRFYCPPGYYMHITDEEDVQRLLAWMRAFEPISYNYDGVSKNGFGAFFIFHLTDGRLYTVGYDPTTTREDSACSFQNDVARINVPMDLTFLMNLMDEIAGKYENHPEWRELVPVYGYSNPGDPLMRVDPYLNGSTPRP